MRCALTGFIVLCLMVITATVSLAQEKRIEGKVNSVDFSTNTVSVKLESGEIVEIIIEKDTEILVETESSSIDAIKYGENIWASYKTVNGKKNAIKVIITRPEEEGESEIVPQVM